MVKSKRIAQLEQWLRLIERTRLFCNTAAEMEQLVGFSVSSRNPLSRKGGKSLFMKEAIFHQLGYICNERTGIDLEEIVEAYEDVDNFITRYSIRLYSESVLSQIVDYFFANGSLSEELDFVGKWLEEKHIGILFLMMTDALPRLSSKNGDVVDIDGDYRRTFARLREVCRNIHLLELPAISIMEEEIRRDPTKKSRLHLIKATNHVLSAYGAISTQERLSFTNRELMNRRIMPEIGGIWTENDSYTSFWHFEEIANGYNMYRYELKDNRQVLRYSKFFASFYQHSNYIEAVIVHPKALRILLSGQNIPTTFFSYLEFNEDDSGLSFEAEDEQKEWFKVSRLIRSAHEKLFQGILSDSSIRRVNEYADDDYDFTMLLAAITQEYIYIKLGESQYYKVPRSLNDVLYDVQFGDNVGLLTFSNETYVAFDDKNLYYDVSSEEKMREYGIEIVNDITE